MNVDRFYTTKPDMAPEPRALKTMYRISHGHVQFVMVAADGNEGRFCMEPEAVRAVANALLEYADRAEAHPESVGGGA